MPRRKQPPSSTVATAATTKNDSTIIKATSAVKKKKNNKDDVVVNDDVDDDVFDFVTEEEEEEEGKTTTMTATMLKSKKTKDEQQSKLILEFIKGPAKGSSFENPKNLSSLHIGRVRGNEIYVKDAAVSQKHAHVYWNTKETQWEIVDLGSSNGTFVDDVELHESSEARALKDGSTIKIGNQTTVVARISILERRQLNVSTEAAEKIKNKNNKNDNARLLSNANEHPNEEENEEQKKEDEDRERNNNSNKLTGGVAKTPTPKNREGKSIINNNTGTKRKMAALLSNKSSPAVVAPLMKVNEKDQQTGSKKRSVGEEVRNLTRQNTRDDDDEDEDEKNEVLIAKKATNKDNDDAEKNNNETTLERLTRWRNELIEDVRASTERAIAKIFREKKKIEQDLLQEFNV
jgi:pSer/pThr/pTyr-binding forkhead associated (FHA) protein